MRQQSQSVRQKGREPGVLAGVTLEPDETKEHGMYSASLLDILNILECLLLNTTYLISVPDKQTPTILGVQVVDKQTRMRRSCKSCWTPKLKHTPERMALESGLVVN